MSIVPSRINGVYSGQSKILDYTIDRKVTVDSYMLEMGWTRIFIQFFSDSCVENLNRALHCACSKIAINEISTVLREISFFVCIILRLQCTHMFVPLSLNHKQMMIMLSQRYTCL